MVRKVRCLSCRKLKIGCDKGRPKCEYCVATGRECVYGSSKSPSLLPPISQEPSTHMVEEITTIRSPTSGTSYRLYNDSSLNSMCTQLGINKFEFHLLCQFHACFLETSLSFHQIADNPNLSPLDKLWLTEVPRLWQGSAQLRQNVYAMTSLHLEARVSLQQMVIEDLGPHGVFDTFGTSTSVHDATRRMSDITLAYFGEAVHATRKSIDELVHGKEFTVETAAATVFSSIILFTFLSLQPHCLIPLVDPRPHASDLIKLVSSMKAAMACALPVMFHTRYHGVFYLAEFLRDHDASTTFPVVEHLRDDLHRRPRDDDGYWGALEGSLNMLDRCFARAMKTDDYVLLFRYVFLMDFKVYDLIEAGDYLSHKILYYYSIISLLCGMSFSNQHSVFRDFAEMFREKSFERFGGWEHDMDRDMYLLAASDFSLKERLSGLAEFVPGAMVREGSATQTH
ncbi:hypothetical protein CANTEDRAFT_137246 [Yamadazyma tenuis ATCC 10573]|uniref:Zn(2)-C6 fungal-type domain-containing protein n=1 Tax=Candida tenuis (strain ATCC 10573 / BCRC 21748 / CBS 615 / JCM 9827 / NBRC 10315 / NRRL Y-1498 / VKM Y-70) TaxID=590646 RepID=G3BC34_CANTC|nr:uncharacterized protein CANTEDRAFT_137246 [Yamadazyma tenuis ATCC 10573]EGV60771.1 hypothetical protein CANTEDRAFT_137246 [Yamadazyma tenuis ATCC 10573]